MITLNFPERIWVRAEIAQAKMSRGHTYLELAEKAQNSDVINAQASGILWQHERRKIEQQVGDLDALFQPGTEVSLLVEIQFHKVFGFSLQIKDIDPAYTLGKLELLRQQTIQRAQQEGLLDLNRKIPVPVVMQHIAVISSEQAAGYQDFRQQLQTNEWGYAFRHELFSNAMQGKNVGDELIKNLQLISQRKHEFDCVVIIRGGGSRMDLQSFDRYDETDQSVVDLASHQSFKTPTAVAAFLLEHNARFEARIQEMALRIEWQSKEYISMQMRLVDVARNQLWNTALGVIRNEQDKLDRVVLIMNTLSQRTVERSMAQLRVLKSKLQLLHPEAMMKRGFTLTTINGRWIRSSNEIVEGGQLVTHWIDGQAVSVVKQIERHEES